MSVPVIGKEQMINTDGEPTLTLRKLAFEAIDFGPSFIEFRLGNILKKVDPGRYDNENTYHLSGSKGSGRAGKGSEAYSLHHG